MMPVNLSLTPPVPVQTDVIDDLLACHARIRHHLELAQRIVEGSAASSAKDIAEAAADVTRYFTVALPLHAMDEDLSLWPRLAAATIPPGVRALLTQTTLEHRAMNQIIEEIAPLWREVAAQPSICRGRRTELGVAVAELDALFEEHLRIEEEILFPALRRHLDPATLAEARREMRARR